MIEIQNVSKTFVSGRTTVEALHDVNISIGDGSIFGIIGLSGAGKSTLVRCINMLERPTSGEVYVDGQNMGDLAPSQLRAARRGITMIFQQFNLLMQKNCLANVCFPMELAGVPKAEARKKAQELLELVGLPDKAKAYPSQLSGGQKQRVAIARALATDPKVLLCDEATSALDPSTTRQILSLIKDINAKTGITVVVITHQMSVVEWRSRDPFPESCLPRVPTPASVWSSRAGRTSAFPSPAETGAFASSSGNPPRPAFHWWRRWQRKRASSPRCWKPIPANCPETYTERRSSAFPKTISTRQRNS